MKIDKIKAAISIAIALLMAWAFYEISKEYVTQSIVMVVTSILLLSFSGVVAFAASVDDARQSMLIKTISIIVFILSIISCLIFSFFEYNVPFFIIFHALILIIYALVVLQLNKVDY